MAPVVETKRITGHSAPHPSSDYTSLLQGSCFCVGLSWAFCSVWSSHVACFPPTGQVDSRRSAWQAAFYCAEPAHGPLPLESNTPADQHGTPEEFILRSTSRLTVSTRRIRSHFDSDGSDVEFAYTSRSSVRFGSFRKSEFGPGFEASLRFSLHLRRLGTHWFATSPTIQPQTPRYAERPARPGPEPNRFRFRPVRGPVPWVHVSKKRTIYAHRVQVPPEDGLGGEFVLPENGLGGSKDILRMVLDP